MVKTTATQADNLAAGNNPAVAAYYEHDNPPSPPRLETRQFKKGDGWYVLVTSSSGSTTQVGHFASEAEATQWIKKDSVAWLKARQTGSHD